MIPFFVPNKAKGGGKCVSWRGMKTLFCCSDRSQVFLVTLDAAFGDFSDFPWTQCHLCVFPSCAMVYMRPEQTQLDPERNRRNHRYKYAKCRPFTRGKLALHSEHELFNTPSMHPNDGFYTCFRIFTQDS